MKRNHFLERLRNGQTLSVGQLHMTAGRAVFRGQRGIYHTGCPFYRGEAGEKGTECAAAGNCPGICSQLPFFIGWIFCT